MKAQMQGELLKVKMFRKMAKLRQQYSLCPWRLLLQARLYLEALSDILANEIPRSKMSVVV